MMLECQVCKSNSISQMPYINFNSSLFNRLTVNSCNECGISWVHQKISEKSLRKYYNKIYGEWRIKNINPENYFSSDVYMFKPNRSRSQLKLICKLINKEPENILDVGAGFGTTLFIAKSEFFQDTNLFAIDPDKYIQQYLEYLQVKIYKNLDSVPNNKFDLIIASHLLEHFNLHDLPAFLNLIYKKLTFKGLFLIEVPHDNFISYPKIISNIHEPHLIYFSFESIKRLVTSNSFNILFLRTIGRPLKNKRIYFLIKIFNGLGRRLGFDFGLEYGYDNHCIRMILTKM